MKFGELQPGDFFLEPLNLGNCYVIISSQEESAGFMNVKLLDTKHCELFYVAFKFFYSISSNWTVIRDGKIIH